MMNEELEWHSDAPVNRLRIRITYVKEGEIATSADNALSIAWLWHLVARDGLINAEDGIE